MTSWRMPAEWAPHEWVWIGFPHDAAEWPGIIDAARADVAAFANAVQTSGEQVRLVVRDTANAAIAAAMVDRGVQIETQAFGDIWLRDTGPLVVSNGTRRAARLFDFNGWGGKYLMSGDDTIGNDLARSTGLETTRVAAVLEGGAIDVDGTGLAVTTEQCLLNPNRNPAMHRDEIEAMFERTLGITRLLWLEEGLAGDHTDGHVDNLARFVAPGRIAIPVPVGSDDPNTAVYTDASARATEFGLDVVAIPSPGRIVRDGAVIPASYMNFYIANHAVIVPQYNVANDDAACEALAPHFPARKLIGVNANGIIGGGGSFHCASQQMPSAAGWRGH